MSFTIKRATVADINSLTDWRAEAVSELYSGKIRELNPAYFEIMKYETRKYYEEQLPCEGHIAGLVYLGVEEIPAGCGGMCLHDVLPTPDNPSGKCAYIMNIYIREAYRKQGLATSVIKWLVLLARERNVGKIYLEAVDSSKAFYKSLGFCEAGDYMLLENPDSLLKCKCN